MHHLLSSLPWSLDMTEVIVAAVILEKDVAYLKMVMVPIVVDRQLVIRDLGNVSITGEIIISLKMLREIWSP